MAEIMEEKKELTPAETAAPASPETPAKKPEKSTADKKKRRRTIRRIVALVVVAALIAGGVKFFKKKDGSSEVGMATVSYGAISSEVDGSGLVKAKTSETISLTTAGTVMDVFVEEGQKVEQGDPLFTIDDLLPHLATDQVKKPLGEAIPAESLNLLVGSRPLADDEGSDRVKIAVLELLHRKYGIVEEDFISAALSAVTAFRASDVGFDRSGRPAPAGHPGAHRRVYAGRQGGDRL